MDDILGQNGQICRENNSFYSQIELTLKSQNWHGMTYKTKSIYDSENYLEIMNRIDHLKVTNQRLWGTMTVSQMLAHCNQPIEMALRQEKVKRAWLGYFLGKWAKKGIYNYKPYKAGLPTAKEYIIEKEVDFENCKAQLKANLETFIHAGENGAPIHPHAFYGHLTPHDWGLLQYKHLNHHLLQFGG